jgi:hypothetical protein
MKLFISVGLPVDNPFIVNKYTYWYYAIISSACSRHNIEGYKEQHHIIPDCFLSTIEVKDLDQAGFLVIQTIQAIWYS